MSSLEKKLAEEKNELAFHTKDFAKHNLDWEKFEKDPTLKELRAHLKNLTEAKNKAVEFRNNLANKFMEEEKSEQALKELYCFSDKRKCYQLATMQEKPPSIDFKFFSQT